MACDGVHVPTYKKAKHVSLNPYWKSTDANLASLGVNTTDEFIVTEVLVEGPSMCARCKKERCDEVKKKDTFGLRRSGGA